MATNTRSVEHHIIVGSLLGKHYKVEALLGQGGFGCVTKCRNIITDSTVAIKVNRNKPGTLEQAKLEIEILMKLRCLNPDTCNIVRWYGSFIDKQRICLIFEHLDQDMFDYLQDRNSQGLAMTELRPIIHQLTKALSHLKSMKIVHGDVKPENIMVVDRLQQPPKVKLIDFGLACHVSTVKPGKCVQSTWYRAPEVMLGVLFNEAIDMWSLGLVAAELATGSPIYPGKKQYDVLNFIIETQGAMNEDMLDRGVRTIHYFKKLSNSHQRWRLMTPEEFKDYGGYQANDTRNYKLQSLDDIEPLMAINGGIESEKHLLMDMIKQMMQLRPEERIKPRDALKHPYFAEPLPQSLPVSTCTEMIDTEDVQPGVSQQPSCCKITPSGKKHCGTDNTTVSRAAALKEDNKMDVQLETKDKNEGRGLEMPLAFTTDTQMDG